MYQIWCLTFRKRHFQLYYLHSFYKPYNLQYPAVCQYSTALSFKYFLDESEDIIACSFDHQSSMTRLASQDFSIEHTPGICRKNNSRIGCL
jgi:hypothetical protein